MSALWQRALEDRARAHAEAEAEARRIERKIHRLKPPRPSGVRCRCGRLGAMFGAPPICRVCRRALARANVEAIREIDGTDG